MKRIAPLAVVCLAALMLVPSLALAKGPAASGGARGIATEGPFAGDHFKLEVTAFDREGGDSGRFHLVHTTPDGDLVAEFTGVINCAESEGHTAHLTGTVTEGTVAPAPDFDPAGQTMALTIVDGDDAFGVETSFFPEPHTVAPCKPVAPIIEVVRGNLTVR